MYFKGFLLFSFPRSSFETYDTLMIASIDMKHIVQDSRTLDNDDASSADIALEIYVYTISVTQASFFFYYIIRFNWFQKAISFWRTPFIISFIL